MERLMLIVRMADRIVALAASAVESVVEIDAMTSVPMAPPHVIGLAALRSRVVTMVDPRAVLGLDGGPALPFVAIVVAVEGHPYAIIVDDVVDVREAAGPPASLQGRSAAGWGVVARQSVIIEDRHYLLIDPAVLIDGGIGPKGAPVDNVH